MIACYSIQGKQLFSCLDLSMGYFQIPLEGASREKTAFNTRFGTFQWTRLPMGCTTASGTFSRAMNLILRGMVWEEVIVYLDDINVMATDLDNMIMSLRKVFTRFRSFNVRLKPRKCTFFPVEVEFLGKMVSGAGIRIAPDKLDAVQKWPTPKNAKQVMSFLGFMNYHRAHIPNYGEIAADLYALSNAKSFEWTDRHQYCFEKLKHLITTAPVLAHPTPNTEHVLILDTDASDLQISASLSQVQNGVIKPIAFASHVLMKQHRNYCTTRKELLAIVKFCRQFRHLLLGRFFVIRTDHKSIVWLTRFKNIQGQLARWLEELSQYDFRVIHRRGTEHINAD